MEHNFPKLNMNAIHTDKGKSGNIKPEVRSHDVVDE